MELFQKVHARQNKEKKKNKTNQVPEKAWDL